MTVSGQTPTVRRVSFEYRDDAPAVWTPRRPEFSCAANSVSLMMPTIEPFFVRSARAAVQTLEDREPSTGEQQRAFVERAKRYVTQEALHHGQHVRFNRRLHQRYRALQSLERAIGATYGLVERRGSQRFNLGFAAASETMAYSAARWAATRRNELFDGADEVVATLFLWHLAEEVEHKSVAYDLYWANYRQTSGARAVYAAAMAVALALMVCFVIVGTTVMLTAERRIANPLAWLRLTGWAITFAFELLSNLVVSLLPGHHPDNFADPLWYEVWLQEFDAESKTMPVFQADVRS